jgi:hypothetical protein
MTLIHVSNTNKSNSQEYCELYRISGYTLAVDIDFYANSIEYSSAIVKVLGDRQEWNDIAEYPVEAWHEAATRLQENERIAVFKSITAFLLEVGTQALGILPPTPAEAPAEQTQVA